MARKAPCALSLNLDEWISVESWPEVFSSEAVVLVCSSPVERHDCSAHSVQRPRSFLVCSNNDCRPQTCLVGRSFNDNHQWR